VLVAAVEPPPELWSKIKAQVAGTAQSGEVILPGADMPAAPEPDKAAPDAAAAAAAAPPTQQGGDAAPVEAAASGAQARRAWSVAALMTVAAALLAGVMVAREVRPGLLPAALRPTPLIERVEVVKEVPVPSPRPAQFVAALQKEPFAPAFLLTFDFDRKILNVRTLGAERQQGRSYELWLVSDKFPGPRSLGVVGAQEFTVRPSAASLDSTTIAQATYAISVEPEGGSPTGVPTGPLIYSSKLVQATPTGFPSPTP
jgi:anti-sigma-K factor RskA